MAVNRTVVEDEYGGKPTFRNDLRSIEPKDHDGDDLIEGAIWVLSRDPHQGVRVGPYSLLWYFEIVGPRNCILYYAFDDNEVLFISIQPR